MPSAFQIVHTFAARIILIVWCILYAPILFIYLIMPERVRYGSRILAWIPRVFYVISLKCILLKITYKGKENLPTGPAIFAANHQSSLDIPLVGRLAKGNPHIWLARHELMKTWLLRFLLPRGAVVVNVNFPMKAMRGLLRAINLVRGEHRHLMIFPEGGRYTDDAVHEFFGGFVILAKKTGRPIVPVYINGANRAYPPNTFWIANHPVAVVIGEPFVLGDGEDEQVFKDRVYAWFVEQTKKDHS